MVFNWVSCGGGVFLCGFFFGGGVLCVVLLDVIMGLVFFDFVEYSGGFIVGLYGRCDKFFGWIGYVVMLYFLDLFFCYLLVLG